MDKDQLKNELQTNTVKANRCMDSHYTRSVNMLRKMRSPANLRHYKFNSQALQSAIKEYSGGTERASTIDALGADYGRHCWNDAYTYVDDKGNRAVVLCDDMEKYPYEIRLQIPNGGKTDIYVINMTTLSNHENISVKEADCVMSALAGQLESGASIGELMQNFQQYQRSPYPPEVARYVENQQTINKEIQSRVRKLHDTGRYGICICDAPSNDFDPYMQGKYPGQATVSLFQNNREASGNKTDSITESYGVTFQYGKESRDVAEISMTAMREYEMNKSFKNDYWEKMDMETLMSQGYDRENAQRKLNKIAEQILAGKPLKEIFIENRQFLTPKSAQKLKEDMEKTQQQQTPDTYHLRRDSENPQLSAKQKRKQNTYN